MVRYGFGRAKYLHRADYVNASAEKEGDRQIATEQHFLDVPLHRSLYCENGLRDIFALYAHNIDIYNIIRIRSIAISCIFLSLPFSSSSSSVK